MVVIERYVRMCPTKTFVSETCTIYSLYCAIYRCEVLNHCYLAELCCGAKVAASSLPRKPYKD